MLARILKKTIYAAGLLLPMGLLSCTADISDTGVQSELKSAHKSKSIMVYSNMAEYNWRYVIRGFQEKYPNIEVQAIDLGAAAGFERYYTETSANAATADIIATASPDAWLRFIERGELLEYQSAEASALPEWSAPFPGLYTVSADPMVIIYNKLLMDTAPDSLEALSQLPDGYKGKLTTYNAGTHSFGEAIHLAAYADFGDNAWSMFDQLGKNTRPENGGSSMVEKVTSGEYVAGYYVSGITVFPKMAQPNREKILGWSLIKDGTPVFLRGMGITKQSKDPESAKLLVDYILSHEGQVAVGLGGMTPYRAGITSADTGNITYQDILDEVGEDNIVRIEYPSISLADRKAFLDRWKISYGLEK